MGQNLERDGREGMTIKDVVVYVKTTRRVEYAYKTAWKILRKREKVKYGKLHLEFKRQKCGGDSQKE